MDSSDIYFDGSNDGSPEGAVLGVGDQLEGVEVKKYGTRPDKTYGVAFGCPEVTGT